MNKKGFTLIEITAVVLILGVIFLVSYPTLENILKKSKTNQANLDTEDIIMAAKTYFNIHNDEYNFTVGNNIIVGINKLIEEDLIDKDISSNISDIVKCSIQVNNKLDCKITKNATYKIGDQVTYNGIKFYVIENSDENTDYVTLLKAEPFSVDEVNRYGKGHINKNTPESQGKVIDKNGYGYIAYYSGDKCGDVISSGGTLGNFVETGCTNDYKASDIKYVVDAWSKALLDQKDLKVDSLGYKVRLITYEELADNLGYGPRSSQTVQPSINGSTPEWVYNSKYSYWTMSSSNDSSSSILEILGTNGGATSNYIYFKDAIRPVITLFKSAI